MRHYQRPETIVPLAYYSIQSSWDYERMLNVKPELNPLVDELTRDGRFRLCHWVRAEQVVDYPGQPKLQGTARCWYIRHEDAQTLVPGLEEYYPGEKVESNTWTGRVHFYLVEVYECCGDEGHTDYRLVGYALINDRMYDKLVDSNGAQTAYFDYSALKARS